MRFDEGPYGADQIGRYLDVWTFCRVQGLNLIELLGQFLLVCDRNDAALFGETPGGGDLMIIAMLTEIGPTRHYDNLLSQFESRDDRAHAGMRNDETRRLHPLSKFTGAKKRRDLNILRREVGGTGLREYLGSAARSGPRIDRSDEAIKSPLGADRNKYHRTDPT